MCPAREDYLSINESLNRVFFDGKHRDRPVYLTLGRSGHETIAQDLNVDLEAVEKAICARVIGFFDHRGSPYSNIFQLNRSWGGGASAGPPPFTGMLYVLSYAAEQMHNDGEYTAGNYYDRLANITRIDRTRLTQYAKETTPYWLQLNRWLRETGYEYGRPTASQVNSWEHASYSLSQAVVRLAERVLFHGMFEKYGFSANDQLSEFEMIQFLDDWMQEGGSRHARLSKVWSKPDLRGRVAQAALESLEDWSRSGSVPASGESSSVRHLALVASVLRYPRVKMTACLGLKGAVQNPISKLQSNGEGQLFTISNQSFYGDFALLGPESSVNLPSMLTKGINLKNNDSITQYVYSPRFVIPLIKSENGAYWLEVKRTSLATEHMVLCRDVPRLRDLIEQYFTEAAIPGKYSVASPAELPGIPSGWVLYRGVQLVKILDNIPKDIQDLSPLSSSRVLQALNGMRLGRDIWHKQQKPSFRLVSDEAPTKIQLHGETASGTFSLVQEVESASEICELEVSMDDALEDKSYQIKALSNNTEDAEMTFLLRSAARPRQLRRDGAGELAYNSIVTAIEGAGAGLQLFVRGHQVVGAGELEETAYSTASGIEVRAGEADEEIEPDEEEAAAVIDAENDNCVLLGRHYVWKCEDYQRGQNRTAPRKQKCVHCGYEIMARNRALDKSKVKVPVQLKRADPKPKAPVPLFRITEQQGSFDPDLVYDALCYIGYGSWHGFEDIVLNDTMPPWNGRQIANDFSALGFIDLAVAPAGQRITSWSIAPPSLVFSGDGDAYLSGFRSRPLIAQVSEALEGQGAATLIVPQTGRPSKISFRNLGAENAARAIEKIRDPFGRSISIKPSAAIELAAACQAFGSLKGLLQVAEMGRPQKPQKFNPALVKWEGCDDVRLPGAYRFQYFGTAYAYRSENGQAYLGANEVVKLMAARQAAVKLHGYDENNQEFHSAIGCEPSGLLRRALVACSGDLASTETGKAVYKAVPPQIGAAVLDILYNRDHL